MLRRPGKGTAHGNVRLLGPWQWQSYGGREAEATFGGSGREMEVRQLWSSAQTALLRHFADISPRDLGWVWVLLVNVVMRRKKHGPLLRLISWGSIPWKAHHCHVRFIESRLQLEGRNELKAPKAIGIAFPPFACAAAVKEMGLQKGQALLKQNSPFYPSCCMIHGRTSAGGLS